MKTAIAIIVAAAIIGATIMFSGKGSSSPSAATAPAGDNVYMENGVQVVEIRAKGGYQPRKSVAQAGVPTTIRFNTKSTFDCSAYVSLPSLGIQKALPMNGTTDIDIGTSSAGLFSGTCSMGMYRFQIDFKA